MRELYALTAYLTDILSAFVFRIHKPLIVMKKNFLLISEHVASVVASASDLQRRQVNTHGTECGNGENTDPLQRSALTAWVSCIKRASIRSQEGVAVRADRKRKKAATRGPLSRGSWHILHRLRPRSGRRTQHAELTLDCSQSSRNYNKRHFPHRAMCNTHGR